MDYFFQYFQLKMEGLVNPNESDLKNIHYFLYLDDVSCCVEGIRYVEHEEEDFGIEKKIKKLNDIINHILGALDNIPYENKENLIETIKTKQNSLSTLLKRYQDNKKSYIEFDSYYRDNLFQVYKRKYLCAPLSAFTQRKICLSVTNDIQIKLKTKFEDFLFDYFDLRNSFFDINIYFIKLKKLFNIKI